MSHKRGGTKQGPPAHQNKTVWVPNRSAKKNETEPGSKQRPLGAVTGVCRRCREQIEWRRKYGKYKMLREPGKCASCSRRTIKDAYHAICRECASQQNVCGKCRRPADSIVQDTSALEKEELARLEEALRNMRERDRRSLLREMSKPDCDRTELLANSKLKTEGSDDGEPLPGSAGEELCTSDAGSEDESDSCDEEAPSDKGSDWKNSMDKDDGHDL